MCGDFIRIFVWVFEIYGHIAVAAVVAFGRQFLFRGAAFAWHTILKRINLGFSTVLVRSAGMQY